jgi:coenzyme PQQ synthesis protein D (PqqD)
MKNPPERPPAPLARDEELVVQELLDEVLVYDLRSHTAHCLNKTSALIWSHCDGKTTAAEISALLEKESGAPVGEDAVWFALNKLSKANLLQEPIVLPQAKAGMSRRSAIRRLGVGALMIPAVMTIVAPTAMAGSSIPPACAACVKKKDGVGACPSVCVGLCGTCFDNSGCGAGQEFPACQTCGACLAGGLTRSWVIPGSLNCSPVGC